MKRVMRAVPPTALSVMPPLSLPPSMRAMLPLNPPPQLLLPLLPPRLLLPLPPPRPLMLPLPPPPPLMLPLPPPPPLLLQAPPPPLLQPLPSPSPPPPLTLPPPLLLLEAAAKTRYFVKAAVVYPLHPGHVRTARMDRRSGVQSVEGGFIDCDSMMRIAGSFVGLTAAVTTQTFTSQILPGRETAGVWNARDDETVFERYDDLNPLTPITASRQDPPVDHPRYMPTTDCVAEAMRAANVCSSNVSTLPNRVEDSVRAMERAGFRRIPPGTE